MIGIIQPPNFSLEINRELMFRGETGQREMFFSHLLIFRFLFFLNNAFSFLSSSEWTFCVYWVGGAGEVGERKKKHSKLCKAFLLYVLDSPFPGRPQAYSVSLSWSWSWAEGLGWDPWEQTQTLDLDFSNFFWPWRSYLFLAARGVRRLPSSFGMQASHCTDFSGCGERALGHLGFSSWGAWAQ